MTYNILTPNFSTVRAIIQAEGLEFVSCLSLNSLLHLSRFHKTNKKRLLICYLEVIKLQLCVVMTFSSTLHSSDWLHNLSKNHF